MENYDQVHGTFGKEARSLSFYTGLRSQPVLYWEVLATLAGIGFALFSRFKFAKLNRLKSL